MSLLIFYMNARPDSTHRMHASGNGKFVFPHLFPPNPAQAKKGAEEEEENGGKNPNLSGSKPGSPLFYLHSQSQRRGRGPFFVAALRSENPPRVTEREASPCFPSLEAEHGGSNPNLPPVHCNVSRSTVDGGRRPPPPPSPHVLCNEFPYRCSMCTT